MRSIQILLLLRTSALLAAIMVAPAALAAHYDIYVTNEHSGTLSIIDSSTLAVTDTTPLGKRPRGIEPSPDGERLYVALSGSPPAPPGVDESTLPPADKSADGIGVYSIDQQRILSVIKGVSDPEQVDVGPEGKILVIASEDTGTAVIVNARTGQEIDTVQVGDEPEGVGISPDGKFAYVTSEEGGTVAIINLESGTVVKRLKVGARPRGIAFSSDGSRAYVTAEVGDTLAVIDTGKMAVLKKVKVPGDGARPMGVVVSPDDQAVYVTTGRGHTLVAFDADSLQSTGSVEVGTRPWGVVLSPDGHYAFTANGPSNDVTVVDTKTMSIVKKIPVDSSPWGIAIAHAHRAGD